MRFIINGESKLVDLKTKEASLSFLITKLNLNPKLIVVEFNGEILNPQKWAAQEVTDGDILEIVTIVGGG